VLKILLIKKDNFILIILRNHLGKKNQLIKINQLVPISKKDQKKIKKILHRIIQHPNYVYFEELLYKIIFNDKFQEQIGIVDKVKLFKFLSIKDIKFIFKNYNNLEKILLYLTRIY
jgi:hypothetical protein